MHAMNPFDSFCYYREFPYYFYDDQRDERHRLTEGWTEKTVDIRRHMERKLAIFKSAYSSQAFILDLRVGNTTLAELTNEVYWYQGHAPFE